MRDTPETESSAWYFRRAVPSDADRLTVLAYAAKGNWGYPADWMAAWKSSLTLTPEYLATNRVFTAESEGALVGVCAIEDQESHWSLEHVWVDPAHQGRGIGQALVRHAFEAARAIRPGTVQIEADPNAAGFYERLGAMRVGSVPAPMPGDPERELPLYELSI